LPIFPWLDPESLKAKFHALAAGLHPDRFHSDAPHLQQDAARRYSEVTAAYNRLRDPKERLFHLIEIESGRPPATLQSVPAETMELLLAVGQVCRDTDEFLAKREHLTSPLLKAQAFERGLALTDR